MTGEPAASSEDDSLGSRTERLRALQSAWGALAPSASSDDQRSIGHHDATGLFEPPSCSGCGTSVARAPSQYRNAIGPNVDNSGI